MDIIVLYMYNVLIPTIAKGKDYFLSTGDSYIYLNHNSHVQYIIYNTIQNNDINRRALYGKKQLQSVKQRPFQK